MKRLLTLVIFFFGLLSGAYYFYLPELQQIWLQYIDPYDPFATEIAQAQLDDDNPSQEQKPANKELENDLYPYLEEDLNVPEFDLPQELPQEENIPSTPQPETFAVIFRGFDRAIISSKVTSTVQKITHRMGERFQKGDLLIKLDDTVFIGLKRKAEGNLNKALAELSAKEQLYSEDIASIYEVKTAQANVAIAQSDLISADYAIDACYVIAPYNGKVVGLFVEEFELIQEGKPLIEIVNDQFLIGQVLTPASVLKRIQLNQPVEVFVRELNENMVGKILRIDAVIDPASSTFKIDLVFPNPSGRLRAGMIGRVIFPEIPDPYTPIKPVPVESKERENKL